MCFLGIFAKAQEKPMSIDIQAGLPLGDVEKFTTLNSGLNFTYLFKEFSENFYFGARSGVSLYSNPFKNKIDPFVDQSIYFANLALVARYDFNEHLFARLDVGYSYEIDGDHFGGFFYEPRIGYSIKNVETFMYFQHIIIDEDVLPMAVGLGVGYRF